MLDYCMDSGGTTTEWVSYDREVSRKYRIPKSLDLDVAVMPGECATPDVIANDSQRRLLASVIRKFERHATVSSVSHEAAIAFVDALPRTAPLPKVAPDGDGGLFLAWTLESGARTLVTIDGWTIHCVSRAGTEKAKYYDDLAFDGTRPAEVQEAIAE